MEGVECMHGESEMCIWKGWSVCVHGEREGVCIWKGSSVHAWGEGGCVYGRGRVCVHGEREGVHMEGWSVHA